MTDQPQQGAECEKELTDAAEQLARIACDEFRVDDPPDIPWEGAVEKYKDWLAKRDREHQARMAELVENCVRAGVEFIIPESGPVRVSSKAQAQLSRLKAVAQEVQILGDIAASNNDVTPHERKALREKLAELRSILKEVEGR